MGLQKARIVEDKNPGEAVAFQFNPETISFTKSSDWKRQTTQSKAEGPSEQFKGTTPLELSLKMILDDTGEKIASVSDRVTRLLRWTAPEKKDENSAPALLKFEWGKLRIGLNQTFNCHCQSVGIEYSMFLPDGTPIRATATVKLVGVSDGPGSQNPTSGAIQPVRSHRVMRGDTLGVISNEVYGSSKHWRAVAAMNNVDNPFRLLPGQELVLPRRIELPVATDPRGGNARG